MGELFLHTCDLANEMYNNGEETKALILSEWAQELANQSLIDANNNGETEYIATPNFWG